MFEQQRRGKLVFASEFDGNSDHLKYFHKKKRYKLYIKIASWKWIFGFWISMHIYAWWCFFYHFYLCTVFRFILLVNPLMWFPYVSDATSWILRRMLNVVVVEKMGPKVFLEVMTVKWRKEIGSALGKFPIILMHYIICFNRPKLNRLRKVFMKFDQK